MLKSSIITAAAVLAATLSVSASAQNVGDTVTCSVTGTGTFGCANPSAAALAALAPAVQQVRTSLTALTDAVGSACD